MWIRVLLVCCLFFPCCCSNGSSKDGLTIKISSKENKSHPFVAVCSYEQTTLQQLLSLSFLTSNTGYVDIFKFNDSGKIPDAKQLKGLWLCVYNDMLPLNIQFDGIMRSSIVDDYATILPPPPPYENTNVSVFYFYCQNGEIKWQVSTDNDGYLEQILKKI